MNVIKRSGQEVPFDKSKIVNALTAANQDLKQTGSRNFISKETIASIANRLYERCRKRSYPTKVEEIQDMIETELMKEGAYELARRYIRYRCLNSSQNYTPILYSTGCIKCRELKEELSSHGIAVRECNDVDKMLSLGFDEVPMLEVCEGTYLNYTGAINWLNGGLTYEKQ